VIEETPSPAVSPALRSQLTAAAAAIARAAGYTNAGTIEFLLDTDGRFYFLEMNTRLQVEHPITEAVTGVDLVQWQLRIASGERLTLDPPTLLVPRGHAIECRIYAEDPDQNFMPAPGLVRALRPASGPGIRDDGGVTAGYTVPVFYDSMIAKLVAWADNREQAIARMSRALSEYQVLGIRTTIPFFVWLMKQDDYRAARYDTTWLDRLLTSRRGMSFNELQPDEALLVTLAAALETYQRATADSGRSDADATAGLWQRAARAEALRAWDR
jgi:acetyl/propionyl-CoA carboxylase alpha subunit